MQFMHVILCALYNEAMTMHQIQAAHVVNVTKYSLICAYDTGLAHR
jgi:hypothetical protein